MAESVQSPEDAAAARAAEQARLRKERREAKIRAGGAARLNKITGLGGGIQRDPPPPQPPSPSSTPPSSQPTATPAAQSHDDPAEVDISKHYHEPRTMPRQPADPSNISEAQLRQMMLGLDQPSQNPLAGAQPPAPGMGGMEEDPMMKMLSQMMSGGGMPGGSPGGGANPFAGTGMESLFAGGNPMQQAQQQAAPPNKAANLWRILHAIFALGLGLYVALSTTFTGTKTERDDSTIASSGETDDIERTRASFFYIFTSVEAVLLTTQYFLDRNRSPPSGMLWSFSGFLPEPFGGYLKHALRYLQIFTTVRGDALVCVFVLGVCCWLRS
ncbi:hypothetical protein DL768_008293 [Monosporascus sp. mg162]|nr:hypothetical protein DL768_008293 [Monosporascus sp. mg162]